MSSPPTKTNTLQAAAHRSGSPYCGCHVVSFAPRTTASLRLSTYKAPNAPSQHPQARAILVRHLNLKLEAPGRPEHTRLWPVLPPRPSSAARHKLHLRRPTTTPNAPWESTRAPKLVPYLQSSTQSLQLSPSSASAASAYVPSALRKFFRSNTCPS